MRANVWVRSPHRRFRKGQPSSEMASCEPRMSTCTSRPRRAPPLVLTAWRSRFRVGNVFISVVTAQSGGNALDFFLRNLYILFFPKATTA